jgi:hypothetical protein
MTQHSLCCALWLAWFSSVEKFRIAGLSIMVHVDSDSVSMLDVQSIGALSCFNSVQLAA